MLLTRKCNAQLTEINQAWWRMQPTNVTYGGCSLPFEKRPKCLVFLYFCRRSSSCISRGTWAQRPLWWLRTSPGWTGRCGLLLWGRTHRAPGSAASYTDSCRANETVRQCVFTSACMRFKCIQCISLNKMQCFILYCVNIPCVCWAVIRLIQTDESQYPFSKQPPAYLRAHRYKYWFSEPKEDGWVHTYWNFFFF